MASPTPDRPTSLSLPSTAARLPSTHRCPAETLDHATTIPQRDDARPPEMRKSVELVDKDGAGSSAALSIKDARPRDDRKDKDTSVPASPGFISLRATPSIIHPLLDTSSNAASSTLPSPPAEPTRDDSFVPPVRSKSTPYTNHEAPRRYFRDPFKYESDVESSATSSTSVDDDLAACPPSTALFNALPAEVHEAILDHIFGYRVSATSSSEMRISSVTKRWNTALRHSRRRELTELALVNPLWRGLIQQRLYRHIKLKATVDVLQEAMQHFVERPHLQPYVKHIEIWFSVFQPTYGGLAISNALMLPMVTTDGLTNTTYKLPENNCTLREVFQFVAETLPLVKVLTLEGGERRKAPKVTYYYGPSADLDIPQIMPTIDSVETLVTKGQWNLMRDNQDFNTVLGALPNLTEWQASYSKPKAKSYLSMAGFLPRLPPRITNLNLCLETDYRREAAMPSFYSKVAQETHVCARLAETLQGLEHFAYTGRVCHRFFDMVTRSADPRNTRLKSIDLTVKNCCRPLHSLHDSGSGIQDLGFIDAFEKLVVAAVRALGKLEKLEYLRIRFVDLGTSLFCLIRVMYY